jgi:hypothetical protein
MVAETPWPVQGVDPRGERVLFGMLSRSRPCYGKNTSVDTWKALKNNAHENDSLDFRRTSIKVGKN